MFFQESETLLNDASFPKAQIEVIDNFLGRSVNQFIDPWKISFHTDVDVARVTDILAEYQNLGVLIEENVLECDVCLRVWALNAPNKSYCYDCERVIDSKFCRALLATKIDETRMMHPPDDCTLRLKNCTPIILDDLQACFKRQDVVFLVGAGASISATQNDTIASWKGLLLEGISRCKQVGQPPPNKNWLDIVSMELQDGGVSHFLSVAEKVSSKLAEANELKRFFAETVGRLKAKDGRLIQAIMAFGAPVMTTNYDNMLSDAGNLQPISWYETDKVHDWHRCQRKGVLHVHGYWDDPVEKIIFGTSSYTRITDHRDFKAMMEIIRGSKNIVFLGFGSSLEDPHFATIFKWGAEIFKNTNQRHFKFCRTGESALSQLELDNRIAAVEYGSSYDDLAPFLECLRKHQ